MFYSNLCKFFLFFTLFTLIFADMSCNNDKSYNCKSASIQTTYSEDANTFQTYLNNIKAAKSNYIPCNATDCGCFISNIKRDLSPFSKGINKKLLDSVNSKGTKYQIIENRLYRDKNCMFPARCAGIEHFLLEIIDKLPDMEFVVNTRDWPQIHRQYSSIGPVFSFSKTSDYLDIMYPAWAFWEGGPAISLYPRGIGRWDRHRESLGKLGNTTKWEDKKSKAFFRGSRTSSERDALILLSRDQPALVDAQYTKNQAWKSQEDTLNAPPAAEVSFEDHCHYKYLFNFRGVAASFRFKHILLCKSLVFHVGDEWQEFFYSGLKPWIHYIPVPANAGKKEIESLLKFAKSHDEVVREIAENGYEFIWNHLRLKDVSCYWLKLLKRYSKLLDYIPDFEEGFIEITK